MNKNSYIYILNFSTDMNNPAIKNNLGIILAVGSVWGLTEFAFGMGLQKCATLYTGAILTGISFFFILTSFRTSRALKPNMQ